MLPMPLPGWGQAYARTLYGIGSPHRSRVRAWACPRPGGEERGIPTILNLTPIGVAMLLMLRKDIPKVCSPALDPPGERRE